jgi:cytochrome P450
MMADTTQTPVVTAFDIADGLGRHARYAQLAAAGPVHLITLPTGELAWLITGYDEVRQALHDPRLVKSDLALANVGRDLLPPEVFAAVASHMLNGPDVLVAAVTAMVSYLRKLVEAKRTDGADDLLSALVAARDGQDRLSDDELTSMVFLLLVAGHETTVNLIGNAVHALLTHPEQLAPLRAQQHRLPDVIEEMLRFDPPLQVATFRWSAEPVDIGGVTIPAGEIVLPGLLAANRDPACAAQPDALDIARTDNAHLGFGHGIHHCLGAPLARLEGRIALGTLLARFPRLRLAVPAQQLTWRRGVVMNGLAALPVAMY